ncbi:MAG: TRL-like family protein [Elusimicrobia bacterium]|nr:TRL-like family protein [Elusimicrobiota bacterium]MDY5729848.1 TRL-like family protein [Elusimicrobiaceae bacterium]
MKKVLFATLCAAALCACATPRTEVGSALFSQTQQPMLVSGNKGGKVGKACATNILGLLISGDMSVEAAKKNGRITQVATVDKDIKSYAVYAEVCTVVTGQ